MRRNHHLPFDDGQRKLDTGHGVEAVGGREEIIEGTSERPHDHMAVEAENLVEQLLAKAVHHGKHNDQRCHAEHDAQHAEERDDGYGAFLAPRPKVAKSKQPLEWRKRHRLPCGFDCHALTRVLA